jgi:hypothetical protein
MNNLEYFCDEFHYVPSEVMTTLIKELIENKEFVNG